MPRGGKAPDSHSTRAQREALLAFASNGFASLKQDTDAELAARQIKNLRCNACHTLDAEASTWSKLDEEMPPQPAAAPHEEGEGKPMFSTALPPPTWLGEKLKPDWMAKFIAGHGGEEPRPWLIPRMPGFTAAVTEPLARGLAHQHGLALTDAPAPKPDFIKAGETLIGESGGFNCTTCHGVGDKPRPQSSKRRDQSSPQRDRMRHGFYSRWVLNPQRRSRHEDAALSDDDGKTPTDLLKARQRAIRGNLAAPPNVGKTAPCVHPKSSRAAAAPARRSRPMTRRAFSPPTRTIRGHAFSHVASARTPGSAGRLRRVALGRARSFRGS